MPDATAHPPPPAALRATAIVATVGVVVAIAGLLLLLRPVTTPVQDCGTALGFLLDGRTNTFADPADPPDGLTEAEVTDNNERPCRVRVADTARPGAIAFVAGMALAIVALLVEAVARGSSWLRRRARARRDRARATPAPPPPQPPATPGDDAPTTRSADAGPPTA
ncbi:MAG: hypothetical protein KDA97_06685 [Acidimicrobiales bacterium]|nr:hypothetical protein [Acidimicrobiales bacterium]